MPGRICAIRADPILAEDYERREFASGSFDRIFASLILEYDRPNRLLGRVAD